MSEHGKIPEIAKESTEVVESPRVCSFSIESLLAPSKKTVEEENRISIQTEAYLHGHECKCERNMFDVVFCKKLKCRVNSNINLNSERFRGKETGSA